MRKNDSLVLCARSGQVVLLGGILGEGKVNSDDDVEYVIETYV